MKILVISFSDLLKPSGFANNVYMDIEYMIKNGFEVVLSCRNYDPTRVPKNLEIISSEKDIILLIKTLQHVFSNNIKAIWIHSSKIHYNLIIVIIGRMLQRDLKIVYRAQDPVPYMYRLLHYHDLYRRTLFSAIASLIESLIVNLSDIVIVVGHTMSQSFFTKHKNKFVLYNLGGVLRLISEEKTQKYVDTNRRSNNLLIGYLGLVQRHVRALEYQILLLRKFSEKYPQYPIKFFILGNASFRDLQYFQNLVNHLKINNVEIIPGPVSMEEISQLLNKIDIAIMEPLSFHLPSKFFEYIYSGKILIINKHSKDMISILQNSQYFFIIADYSKKEDVIKQLYELSKNIKSLPYLIQQNQKVGQEIIEKLIDENTRSYKRIFYLLKRYEY